jgi:hypothetical protein
MVWFSYATHDVSQGLVPVPLWIPQAAMALGLATLFVALLDDLVVVLAGKAPAHGRAHGAAPSFER